MPMIYTVQERLEMVRQHERGDSYWHIRDNFQDANPERPIPAITTIRKLVIKFRATGIIDPRAVEVQQPTRQMSAATKAAVLQSLQEDGTKTASRVAQEVDISKSSVRNIVKERRVRPFKYGEVQQLTLPDLGSRLNFCEIMKNRLRQDDGIRRICFTDESTIVLVGGHNRHNLRFYSSANPHKVIASHTQWQQKLNVWAGLYANQIVGPFFIEGNLNRITYLRMLEEQIVPALRALEGDGPPIWYQQDGAPAHYAGPVRAYFNQEFPDRWIGRLGPVQWPARSPDLTPLDFGLWPYLKSKLYRGDMIGDLPALRARVLQVLADMTPQAIFNTTNSFWARPDGCVAARGSHFEHLPGWRRRGRVE